MLHEDRCRLVKFEVVLPYFLSVSVQSFRLVGTVYKRLPLLKNNVKIVELSTI